MESVYDDDDAGREKRRGDPQLIKTDGPLIRFCGRGAEGENPCNVHPCARPRSPAVMIHDIMYKHARNTMMADNFPIARHRVWGRPLGRGRAVRAARRPHTRGRDIAS